MLLSRGIINIFHCFIKSGALICASVTAMPLFALFAPFLCYVFEKKTFTERKAPVRAGAFIKRGFYIIIKKQSR